MFAKILKFIILKSWITNRNEFWEVNEGVLTRRKNLPNGIRIQSYSNVRSNINLPQRYRFSCRVHLKESPRQVDCTQFSHKHFQHQWYNRSCYRWKHERCSRLSNLVETTIILTQVQVWLRNPSPCLSQQTWHVLAKTVSICWFETFLC